MNTILIMGRIHCLNCGYGHTGMARDGSQVCPECGTKIPHFKAPRERPLVSVAIRSILIGLAAWCGIAIVCAVVTGTWARRSVWLDYWIMSSPLTVAIAMLFACREERRIVRLFGNRSKGWLGACCFLILVLSGFVYFITLVIVMIVLEAL